MPVTPTALEGSFYYPAREGGAQGHSSRNGTGGIGTGPLSFSVDSHRSPPCFWVTPMGFGFPPSFSRFPEGDMHRAGLNGCCSITPGMGVHDDDPDSRDRRKKYQKRLPVSLPVRIRG
jgi:hypothetical protein